MLSRWHLSTTLLLRKQEVEADELVDRLVKAPLYEKRDTFDEITSDIEAAVVVGNLAWRLSERNATLGDVQALTLVYTLGDTLNLRKWELLAIDWEMLRTRRC